MTIMGHYNYDFHITDLCLNIADLEVYSVDEKAFKNLPVSLNIMKSSVFYNIIGTKISLLITHYKFIKLAQKTKTPSLFLSFNNKAILFACLLTWNKKKLHLICHNNLQKIRKSFLDKLCFRLLSFFNMHLIILEDIFKEDLIQQCHYKSNQLSVLYHPLPKLHNINKHNKKITISYISGLYYDKGYDIFLDAINYFLRYMPIHKDKILFKVSLAQKINFDKLKISESFFRKNNVEIMFHYLSSSEYNDILQTSDYICLPIRPNFQNRCSAIFFEGIALKKPMILSNIPLFTYYNKEYPNISEIFTIDDDDAVISLSRIFAKIAANYNHLAYPGITKILDSRSNKMLESQLYNIFQQKLQCENS